VTARLLTDADSDSVWRLNQLVFGWVGGEVPPTLQGQTVVGVDGADGLAGSARLRSYEQWWGGRRVRMGGLAGVAVHPHARGQGAVRALVAELLTLMRDGQQPVSALFPTAPGIYRALGWEIVGSLDDTTIPTAAFRRAGEPGDVTVRTAGPADLPAIAGLYDAFGRSTDGLLARAGPEFPQGAEGVLEHDVVSLAELGGRPVGYLTYARGSGYRGSELRVWELVAQTAQARAALLRSLGTWDAVSATVRWRGPTDELALALPGSLPPPSSHQPWMLRIVDAPAAVAARGFRGADVELSFGLVDPQVPAHARGWRLVVRDGAGRLEPADGADLPQLHVRGLALLWAGAADADSVVRAGLLDQPLPTLDRAFAGQPARILDYF
jgi:predicted acetyltransferase